jgi:tetratricopeptide (TPR) repeat protein
VRCYNKALEIDQRNVFALLLKGVISSAQNNDAEAIQFYDVILQTNPDYGDAWLLKGLSLYRLARYAESIPCYEKALAVKPSLVDAWFLKGNSESKDGRKIAAVSSYQKFVDLAPPTEASEVEIVRDHYMLGVANHGESRLGLTPEELEAHLEELLRLEALNQGNKAFNRVRASLGMPIP